MMLHVSEPNQSLYKCIRNWVEDKDGLTIDLCTYLTIGRYYHLSNNTPCSEWVINIIDDLNKPHDMNKDMFINIQELRETKLKQLGI